MKHFVFSVLFFMSVWTLQAQVHCVIRGSFPGLNTNKVQLVGATLDYRYHGVEIPVRDFGFEYTLDLTQHEVYKLIFVTKDPRVWYFVPFMVEGDTVDIQVNADKSYKISGGKMNEAYQEYLAIQKTKARNVRYDFMHDHFKGQLNELYFFLIVEELQRRQTYQEELDSRIVDAYEVLAREFPSHPYAKLGRTLIDGFNTIKPGGRYVEFEAPDLKGNMVNITDQIKGKIAVLDLWASWCHPCRKKALAMIPVYEEYKDKGFVVVGVAREFKNTKNLELAIEKDGYPWLQLLEMNDSRQIWTRYMLGNAGGGVFLIDRDGTILAVNPTAEQVREVLKEKLD